MTEDKKPEENPEPIPEAKEIPKIEILTINEAIIITESECPNKLAQRYANTAMVAAVKKGVKEIALLIVLVH